ncbi:MAG: DUF4388 domain-containing protein [Myxococcales bacterium]|nr:DUF4388 domain-containing protein [Myxococcales bacterium]
MLDPKDLIVVKADGSIRAAGRGAERRLRDRVGEYSLAIDVPGLLVLRRAEAIPEDAARVLMAGEIISRMTVMEIINVIATSHWRGELTVIGPDATRKLFFDRGALKNAQSDAGDDRLGQVLFLSGRVSRLQLGSMLDEVGPDRRLGELVVERGILDRTELFELLQQQAQQIFFGALVVGEGHYVFSLPPEGSSPPITTLHLSVQGLLMQGVQRIDEMALFRDKIPSGNLVPRRVPGAKPATSLEESHERILREVDGVRSIDEIARESGLGTFETTKSVYHLLQQRQLELHAGRKLDEGAVARLVDQFNEVMQDIFAAVATYGGIAQTRATVESWVHGSGYGPFFGDGIDELGCIDVAHVAEAMKGVELESPLDALHQALHELAAFALFSATTSLPREQELNLARDVNRRLKAIQID